MTSVALENNRYNPVVPNIELATNKAAQYPNERSSFTLLPSGEHHRGRYSQYVDSVPVIKIVCVYDSLRKVEHLLERCCLIIDESRSCYALEMLKSVLLRMSSIPPVISPTSSAL